MPEQAVWQVKRVTWGIPVPTPATLRAAVRMVGPPLLLGLLAAVLATQLQARVWRVRRRSTSTCETRTSSRRLRL
jgi:hypothetical protein